MIATWLGPARTSSTFSPFTNALASALAVGGRWAAWQAECLGYAEHISMGRKGCAMVAGIHHRANGKDPSYHGVVPCHAELCHVCLAQCFSSIALLTASATVHSDTLRSYDTRLHPTLLGMHLLHRTKSQGSSFTSPMKGVAGTLGCGRANIFVLDTIYASHLQSQWDSHSHTLKKGQVNFMDWLGSHAITTGSG